MPSKDPSPKSLSANKKLLARTHAVRPIARRPAPGKRPEPPVWETGAPGVPALPGGKCLTPPHPDWLPSEKWAWSKICSGKAADFNERQGKELGPHEVRDWLSPAGGKELDEIVVPDFKKIQEEKGSDRQNELKREKEIKEQEFLSSFDLEDLETVLSENASQRIIRPGFLRMVLLHEPWRSAVTSEGFRLSGALVSGDVQLNFAKLVHPITIAHSRLLGRWDLKGLSTPYSLLLDGCCFSGIFHMDGAFVGGVLSIDSAVFHSGVCLIGISVSGQAKIEKSAFHSDVVMDSASFKAGLFMDGSRFVQKVRLNSIKVNGQVSLNRVVIDRELNLERAEVGELFTRGSIVKGNVNLMRCGVAGNLYAESFEVKTLARFTDGRAAGIFVGLSNRNAPQPSTFADLKLDGFKYEHMHFNEKGESGYPLPLTAIEKDYLLSFIAKQRDFSPQPYEHMAGLLRRAGQPGRANSILAAGKRRARQVVSPVRGFLQWMAPPKDRQPATYRHLVRRDFFAHFLKRFDIYGEPSKPKMLTWLKRCLLSGVIGHGLGWRYLYSVAWALGIITLGVVLGLANHCLDGLDWFQRYAFSADKFIPFVDLAKWDGVVQVEKSSHYWRYLFFIHQLAGAVIIGLVVMGLTGMVERRK